MEQATDLPLWLEDLGDPDLEVNVETQGTIRLPTGAITACDPLSFLDSARCFARQVEPGEYPIEVGKLEEGGQVAYALIRFSDALIESWDVGLVADRDRPRLGFPSYPADTGVGCFVDGQVAKALIERGQDHFDAGAKWIADRGVDTEDDDAWQEAFEAYEKEHPPPLSDVSAGDVVGVDDADGELVTFATGRGAGTYSSFWALDGTGAPVCLLTDFGLLDLVEGDDATDEADSGATDDDDDDLDDEDDFDGDSDGEGSGGTGLDALLRLVQGGGAFGDDEPAETEVDSPFVILANDTLNGWETDGTVELEDGASRESFVDAFAEFLASEPTPDKLEDWLFDQDAIAEVYGDSDALWQTLRKQARAARPT
ncbi:MAG: hypothetical protein DRJ42_25715 [Deltaproteobacteria bacterium]|nr:MAG: hypothetical protein DRJ42_25715 [Deltaproteobacteria bacterium]